MELEVNVSPQEETVWLTKDQIALLFNRDRTVISRHISNIFSEGELDKKQVCAKNARTGSDGKTYQVDYYNLDVIISVGYRVKSQNGVAFRKWANAVLKEYLLRGYVVNDNRVLITNENYASLVNKVDLLENRLNRIENYSFLKDKVIFNGKVFDALSLLNQLCELAKDHIILIDPYIDVRTLNAFKSKNINVSLTIISSTKNNKVSQMDIDAFKEQNGDLIVKTNDDYHDRYLIIDNTLFYHLGSSVNYLGKKFSQITLIEDNDIIDTLRKRINEHE